MLTIYCGENIAASRKAFAEIRQSCKLENIDCIDITSQTVEELVQAIEGSSSLFHEEKIIFVEGGLTKKPFRDAVKRFADVPSHKIYIWEPKSDPRSIKTYFPKAIIDSFTYPTDLWKFLDGLYPGNSKSILLQLQSLAQSEALELVLYMSQQRMKELILVQANLPGKSKRAPWQTQRLARQAQLWQSQKLADFHHKLFEIESGIKTGLLPYSVLESLDIAISFYL